MTKQEHWLDDVEDHDYDAAEEYLCLLTSDHAAKSVAAQLRDQPIRWFKAKDLLRASGLPALPESNRHVSKDLRKIKRGENLSPILLLRGWGDLRSPLVVADGYHRICASYLLDENAEIPARLL